MESTNELIIQAPVEVVWGLTEHVEGWPAISPTMQSVQRLDNGPMRVGSTARVKQPAQRPAVWTVTEFVPDKRFAWTSTVWSVQMKATHELQPVPSGCRNTLTVEMTGRGSKLLGRLIGGQIRRAITVENLGFKRRAEAATT
ncbi:MAG: SRPBCC family protein [Ilumatobacteraceae bacterium]